MLIIELERKKIGFVFILVMINSNACQYDFPHLLCNMFHNNMLNQP